MNIVGGFIWQTKSGFQFVIAFDPGRKYISVLNVGYLKVEKVSLDEWERAKKKLRAGFDWKHGAEHIESRKPGKFTELTEAMKTYVEGPIEPEPETKQVKSVRRG